MIPITCLPNSGNADKYYYYSEQVYAIKRFMKTQQTKSFRNSVEKRRKKNKAAKQSRKKSRR